MEILLIILAIIFVPIILGSIFQHQDKIKEEQRQASKTERAKENMRNHKFFEKRDFHNGWAVVKLEDFRYAYINKFGAYLNNEIFVKAYDFIDGTAVIRKYDLGANIINDKGEYLLHFENNPKVETFIEEIYPKIYKYIRTIYSKPSYVERRDIFLIKQNGQYILKNPINEVLEIRNNYIKIRIGKLIGEIDFNGRYLNRPFQKKVNLGNGLYRVIESEYAWGIYDENIDQIIIPCKYSSILYFEPLNIFIIKPYGDGTRSFPAFAVNRQNKIVIPAEFDDISILERKHVVVSNYNKQRGCGLNSGLYDIYRQRLIVKPLYGHIWISKYGTIMAAEFDGRCGIVNQNGISNLEYDSYEQVYLSTWDCSSIRAAGWEDIPYTEAFSCKPSYLIVSKNSKFGVIDIDGKIIIPLEFDDIKTVNNKDNIPSNYIVIKNNKYGVFDLNGNLIFPIIYDKIEDKMDIGIDIYIPLHDFYSSTTTIDENFEEMDNFDSCCKGKDRYFTVVKNGHSKTYTFTGEDFTPKPTRDELYRKREIESISKVQENVLSNKIQKTFAFSNKRTGAILFFDTETTGVPKNYNAPSWDIDNWPRLVQLSWLLTSNDGTIISQGDFIIKPNGFDIPLASSKVHGITTTLANAKGVNLTYALGKFLEATKSAEVLVGHNIDFDIHIVGAELIRLGKTDILQNMPKICTMLSTVNFCRIPNKFGYKYPKLQELYYILFNKNFSNAHNSLADIMATKECYFELIKRGVISDKNTSNDDLPF